MPLPGKTPVLRTGKTILSTKNNDNQIITTTITTYNNIIEVSSANLQNWFYIILAGLPKYQNNIVPLLSWLSLIIVFVFVALQGVSSSYSLCEYWFFHSKSGVFLFVELQPYRGVVIMKSPDWKCTYRKGYA